MLRWVQYALDESPSLSNLTWPYFGPARSYFFFDVLIYSIFGHEFETETTITTIHQTSLLEAKQKRLRLFLFGIGAPYHGQVGYLFVAGAYVY